MRLPRLDMASAALVILATMALDPGKRIGPYEIGSPLGAGGMGEVYRATDSKLKREVAIKVLPEGFAGDQERLARFQREAQVLASLNHPNIAAIYGLEESEGAHCLVLELIQGQTIGEMIEAGPVPAEQALGIALQIAEALEAAHEKGVIHRDLKPANVMVTPDGVVKVLDFGLAKAFAGDGGEVSSSASMSPTLTLAATQAGVILGTAAYMSPEQAAGQAADRRSDIWSFGVVLMEMLTGRRTFGGETVSHTLASVLKDEPEWQRLPPDFPPRLRELLRSCLRRKPRRRLQAMGDARVLLEEYQADPKSFTAAAVESGGPTPAPTTWTTRIPWAVAALLTVALAGSLWMLRPVEGSPQEPVRLSISLTDGAFLFRGYGASVLFSPDGTRVAYVTEGSEGGRQLMLRWLDQWEGAVLADGDGGPYQPFFSPDGQWLGYATRSELRKVPVRGGSSIKLCDVALSRGASWGPDGTIIFAPNPQSGLFRVAAAGGEPEPLTQLDEAKQEESQRWPQILPGGAAVLFTTMSRNDDGFDNARIEIMDLESGRRHDIYQGGSYARYVASGHILFVNGGTLFAFPFDLKTLQATGSAAPVIEGVDSVGGQGGAQYSVSRDGNLIYAPGGGIGADRTTLVQVDRKGGFQPLRDEALAYGNPELSPDGTSLAVDLVSEGNWNIWILDLERDVPTRLTVGDSNDFNPIWSPDGDWIYYSSEGDGNQGVYRIPADGSSEAELVLAGTSRIRPRSITPDGSRLFYTENVSGRPDIFSVPVAGGEPEPFVAGPSINYDARISPDGRWVAYGTNESGAFEIYVRPVGGGRGKWQVSEGGVYPRWSRDGRTLFYRELGDGAVMSVAVTTQGGSFQAGRPQTLFNGPFASRNDDTNRYAVGLDDDHFIMFHEEGSEEGHHEHLRVVLNWFDELRQTLPDAAVAR